jgi:hypothetical protein
MSRRCAGFIWLWRQPLGSCSFRWRMRRYEKYDQGKNDDPGDIHLSWCSRSLDALWQIARRRTVGLLAVLGIYKPFGMTEYGKRRQ